MVSGVEAVIIISQFPCTFFLDQKVLCKHSTIKVCKGFDNTCSQDLHSVLPVTNTINNTVLHQSSK